MRASTWCVLSGLALAGLALVLVPAGAVSAQVIDSAWCLAVSVDAGVLWDGSTLTGVECEDSDLPLGMGGEFDLGASRYVSRVKVLVTAEEVTNCGAALVEVSDDAVTWVTVGQSPLVTCGEWWGVDIFSYVRFFRITVNGNANIEKLSEIVISPVMVNAPASNTSPMTGYGLANWSPVAVFLEYWFLIPLVGGVVVANLALGLVPGVMRWFWLLTRYRGPAPEPGSTDYQHMMNARREAQRVESERRGRELNERYGGRDG